MALKDKAQKCEVDVQMRRTPCVRQASDYGMDYGFVPVPAARKTLWLRRSDLRARDLLSFQELLTPTRKGEKANFT